MNAIHEAWKAIEAEKEVRLEAMRAALRRAYASEYQGDFEQAAAYGAMAANKLSLVVGTNNRIHVLEVVR
jgi:hypothetical protein